MSKLTLALDYVGAFIGWTVAGPANATTGRDGSHVAHADRPRRSKVDGKGVSSSAATSG
jgi:hypothetical protein